MAQKKKNSTRRLLFIIGGLVVVLLVVLGVMAAVGGDETGIEVETAEAQRRTLTQTVTASGRVQPEIEVVISPDVSGEIVELTVREGDWVEQGDLLARIQPDEYAAAREQAQAAVLSRQADLRRAEADLLRAEQELRRAEQLSEAGSIAPSELEAAQANRDIAQANRDAAEYGLASARAQLEQAGERLSRTAIHAPMTGTVSQLNVELGERVVGTSQMAGTEMMRVARLDQMEVEVDVNENDVVNVSLGDTADVEVDAYPDEVFQGVVTEIANSARQTGTGQDQVINFPVKVRLVGAHNTGVSGPDRAQASASASAPSDEDEGALPRPASTGPVFRPGMSATVDIATATVADALSVPIQAVTVRDLNRIHEDDEQEDDEASEETPAFEQEENLQRVVFVVRQGEGEEAQPEAAMVQVETGIADDLFLHVTSGLQPGDKVIIGPYRQVSRELEPGDMVRVSGSGV